jgi:hypothetical protein
MKLKYHAAEAGGVGWLCHLVHGNPHQSFNQAPASKPLSFRVINETRWKGRQAKWNQIAKLSGAITEEPEHIAAKVGEVSQQEVAFWPRHLSNDSHFGLIVKQQPEG